MRASPDVAGRARRFPWAAVPAWAAVTLMVLWAVHDGGYDQDTWYWGALVCLSVVAFLVMAGRARWRSLSAPMRLALGAFAAYVAWSYLSLTWAAYPGDALTGSNRSLLYLLLFALLVLAPGDELMRRRLLFGWALGVATIAIVTLLNMSHGHPASLFSEGRLVSPTGYFNSTAALFTSAALVAVALAAGRSVSPLLRAPLLAGSCACLQLALLAESRGWLFTLPVVIVVALVLVRHRLRVTLAAVLPLLGALAPLHSLLQVFRALEGGSGASAGAEAAIHHAARVGLLLCLAVLVIGWLAPLLAARRPAGEMSRRTTTALGATLAIAAIAAGLTGLAVATHGHPARFISRQWHGFTHPSGGGTNSFSSHFASIGTGRYDAWRVALKATGSNPLLGLGQDNFSEYYLRHRRTSLELQWTHSLEMRLLAHTGVVGALLFVTFIASALVAAVRRRRAGNDGQRWLCGAALLPLAVWVIHGSVDWFWEMPALTGPSLGFLALAAADDRGRLQQRHAAVGSARRWLPRGVAATALVIAVVALGFPYLSVRELSSAADLTDGHPQQALQHLNLAAQLNPLSADPTRLAGATALQVGLPRVAQTRFAQAIRRDPGGWFNWLGAGLAASTLGDATTARRDYQHAAALGATQPVVRQALARVDTTHPLTTDEAFNLLIVVH